MDSVRRRRFLAATAAATAGITTGCTGNGDGEGDGDENGTADGTENGGEVEDGQTDGEEAGSDDGETTEGEVRFGDAFGMEDSFAFEVEPKDSGGNPVSGRFYQGNVRVDIETEQGTGEYYNVDGDLYFIMDGTCMKNPSENLAPENSQIEPEDYESEAEEYADLTPTETTTIDRNQVHVFEVTSETPGETETTTTYYVGVDSGNLRRVEAQGSVTNFHSWGDVEPVEAPDMECQDMSDMPSPGDF